MYKEAISDDLYVVMFCLNGLYFEGFIQRRKTKLTSSEIFFDYQF